MITNILNFNTGNKKRVDVISPLDFFIIPSEPTGENLFSSGASDGISSDVAHRDIAYYSARSTAISSRMERSPLLWSSI